MKKAAVRVVAAVMTAGATVGPTAPVLHADLAARIAVIGDSDTTGSSRDGVHPTDAGHAYMAAKIAPLIYPQLAGGV